jgi:transcriptional regulator with XRE-family HTH domain
MSRPIGIPFRRQTDTFERAVGTIVATHRVRNRLSQQALAEKVGYSNSYISQLERGLINPTLRSIMELAYGLGIEPGAFVREIANRLGKK